MMQLALSETASKKLKELIERDGAGDLGDTYLRVYVTGGGCSGFRYGMALDKKIHEGDEVIQNNGIKVIVDGNWKEFIDGSSVDYVETVAGSGFTISNPNNCPPAAAASPSTRRARARRTSPASTPTGTRTTLRPADLGTWPASARDFPIGNHRLFFTREPLNGLARFSNVAHDRQPQDSRLVGGAAASAGQPGRCIDRRDDALAPRHASLPRPRAH